MSNHTQTKFDEIDSEINAIFDFLMSTPEFFSNPISTWKQAPWLRKVEISAEEYSYLQTYGERLTQIASQPSLLFVGNYFKFKKEVLSERCERSVSQAFKVMLLLVLCFTIFYLTANDPGTSIAIGILWFVIFSLTALFLALIVRRDSQEFQLFSKLELLLEIAQRQSLGQDCNNQT